MNKALFKYFATVLIITLLFSSSVSMVILSDQMMQTTRKDMYYTVKLVENQIDYQKPLDNQVEKLNDLAYTKDTRLTIIDKNGNVLADSDKEGIQENHSGRSEFKEALSDEFKVYQQQVLDNAKALADELVKKRFRIVSGGTDNHLMLVDLRSKNITGKEAQFLLDEIGITANRNTIPFEPLSPFVTSGIRLGTPALTTRGLKEDDIREVADIIADVIENREDGAVIETAKAKVQAICKKFPLYEE